MAEFPTVRLRRLRGSDAVRRLAQETRLSASSFIYPLFVTEAGGAPQPIEPMPGCYQLPISALADEAREVASLGIPAVLLFGLPNEKDDMGSQAYAPEGVVQEAVRAIKAAAPGLAVVTDVCMCEYTDHGHCGILDGATVDNDATLDLLARTAVSHAEAGADVVAPSAMMDGQVAAIRAALDDAGSRTRRSWPTPPSTPRPSTDRSVWRRTRRRRLAIGAATRWTRPTPAWRCGSWSRTRRRGRTS